jgi:hypothetical protein
MESIPGKDIHEINKYVEHRTGGNTIRRDMDIKLTKYEEIEVIRSYAKNSPDILKILLEHPKGNCPFPESCNSFPCKHLCCHADSCSNGFAYRMS